MKYTRLTKEQLLELHPEFTYFLASQSIDKNEWETIKTDNPQLALDEIDVFSDVIWDKALTNVQFVDHFSEKHIFLFHCMANELRSLVIKTTNETADLLTKTGLDWLGEHLFSNEVEIQNGKKEVGENRNEEVFKIIQQGGIISKGELYLKLTALINQ